MRIMSYKFFSFRLLRFFFFALIILLPRGGAFGQVQTESIVSDTLKAKRDFIDYMIKWTNWDSKHTRKVSDKKLQFSLMPLSGDNSENGITVSSINASFYIGERATTKLSNVIFYPTTDFSSYFKFEVMPNLWLPDNSWNIPARFEYSYTQRKTYGLGTNTIEDSLVVVNYNSLISHISLNKEILPDFFIGTGYYLDYFFNITQDWDEDYPSSFERYEYGTSSESLSSGVAVNILFDNRTNPINAVKGLYSNLTIVFYDPAFGSQYTWKSVFFDTRRYINLSTYRRRVVALRGLFWGTWGEVPFLNIPGTRLGEAFWTGRGYYKGRYRGNQMIYAEAEYRFDLTRSGLWGGVLFVNGESLKEPDNRGFRYVKPAAGFGLRLKFNKFSDSNLTTDLAFGKGSVVWFVGLNEAF